MRRLRPAGDLHSLERFRCVSLIGVHLRPFVTSYAQYVYAKDAHTEYSFHLQQPPGPAHLVEARMSQSVILLWGAFLTETSLEGTPVLYTA
jgi:hypothetical protein